MKTIAVDTNVLLDFQRERSPGFAESRRLIESCLEGQVQIFISQVVFPELEWVLRSYYKESQEKIVEFFEELLNLDGIILRNKLEINQALLIFKQRNIKFADAIIFAEIKSFKPDEFLTFDEELNRLYNKNTN